MLSGGLHAGALRPNQRPALRFATHALRRFLSRHHAIQAILHQEGRDHSPMGRGSDCCSPCVGIVGVPLYGRKTSQCTTLLVSVAAADFCLYTPGRSRFQITTT